MGIGIGVWWEWGEANRIGRDGEKSMGKGWRWGQNKLLRHSLLYGQSIVHDFGMDLGLADTSNTDEHPIRYMTCHMMNFLVDDVTQSTISIFIHNHHEFRKTNKRT
jgi:hypothetical protein